MASQSTIVFFFLLTAFVIFITQRGELPAYLALVFGGGPAPAPQAAASSKLGDAAALFAKVAPLVF